MTGSGPAGQGQTMEQDLSFGLRQLVDIAERALSPGINDPTTAVQTLDELHDLLRRVVSRHLPDGQHRDQEGTLRLVMPPASFPDLLALALDEIEQYGHDSSQVQGRIDELLTDLAEAPLPEHRPAVLARLRMRGLAPSVAVLASSREGSDLVLLDREAHRLP